MAITSRGNEAVLKDGRGKLTRLAVKELLLSDRACVMLRARRSRRYLS